MLKFLIQIEKVGKTWQGVLTHKPHSSRPSQARFYAPTYEMVQGRLLELEAKLQKDEKNKNN